MATSCVKTQLPLDTFAKIVGINPLHFNQITVPMQPSRVCGDVLLQYSWQTPDKVGRDELAQGIADAEALITHELGYDLIPTWHIDEKRPIPRVYAPELRRSWDVDIRWNALGVRGLHGYVQDVGVEKWTLLEAAATVTFHDDDGDDYFENATVVITNPDPINLINKEEIALVYDGQPVCMEIRPIQVGMAGASIIIQFKTAQIVRWDLIDNLDPQGVDGMDITNFDAFVDVYRHYNDTSRQADILTETAACTCGAGCDVSTVSGCLVIRDPRNALLGVTNIGIGGDVNGCCFIGADRVNLYYRAGWKDLAQATPFLTMDPMWARAVSYLALALLDRPLCGCDALRAFTEHWSEDLAESKSTPGGSSNVDLGRVRDNPIGTTRAAIFAWRLIRRNIIGEAAEIA
jgi:hypothetical protein